MNHLDRITQTLRQGSPLEKAVTLVTVSQLNEVPDDILELIASLRQDRTAVRMYIPFRYGELAYLATQTYAFLRYRRGIKEPVTIRDTVIPLKSGDLSRICDDSGVEIVSDDPEDWFAALKERGLLSTEDVTFDERSFDLDD